MSDYRPDAIMLDAVSRILDSFDFDNPTKYHKSVQKSDTEELTFYIPNFETQYEGCDEDGNNN